MRSDKRWSVCCTGSPSLQWSGLTSGSFGLPPPPCLPPPKPQWCVVPVWFPVRMEIGGLDLDLKPWMGNRPKPPGSKPSFLRKLFSLVFTWLRVLFFFLLALQASTSGTTCELTSSGSISATLRSPERRYLSRHGWQADCFLFFFCVSFSPRFGKDGGPAKMGHIDPWCNLFWHIMSNSRERFAGEELFDPYPYCVRVMDRVSQDVGYPKCLAIAARPFALPCVARVCMDDSDFALMLARQFLAFGCVARQGELVLCSFSFFLFFLGGKP